MDNLAFTQKGYPEETCLFMKFQGVGKETGHVIRRTIFTLSKYQISKKKIYQ